MSDIDPDLFRLLLIGIGVVAVLVLLSLATSLGRIKKELSELAAARKEDEAAAADAEAGSVTDTGGAFAEGEAGPASGGALDATPAVIVEDEAGGDSWSAADAPSDLGEEPATTATAAWEGEVEETDPEPAEGGSTGFGTSEIDVADESVDPFATPVGGVAGGLGQTGTGSVESGDGEAADTGYEAPAQATPEWEPTPASEAGPPETKEEETPFPDTVFDEPFATHSPGAEAPETAVGEEAATETPAPGFGIDDVSAGSSGFGIDDVSAASLGSRDPNSEVEERVEVTTGADDIQPEGAGAIEAAVDQEAPADTTAPDITAGGNGDIPEEEPFERAGRWWFKRGGELLVYNESIGEWVPSPTPLPEQDREPEQERGPEPDRDEEPAAAGLGAEETATQTLHEISSTAVEETTQPQEAVSGFWKCPSCGAVNGSTSTSCRMCFSAKPA